MNNLGIDLFFKAIKSGQLNINSIPVPEYSMNEGTLLFHDMIPVNWRSGDFDKEIFFDKSGFEASANRLDTSTDPSLNDFNDLLSRSLQILFAWHCSGHAEILNCIMVQSIDATTDVEFLSNRYMSRFHICRKGESILTDDVDASASPSIEITSDSVDSILKLIRQQGLFA